MPTPSGDISMAQIYGTDTGAKKGGCPFAEGSDTTETGREPVYYHTYLGLHKVLDAQDCLSRDEQVRINCSVFVIADLCQLMK